MIAWYNGHCGGIGEINIWNDYHGDFDYRKYFGSAGWKEEVRYG